MPEVKEDIVVNLRAVAAAPLLSTGTRSPDATWLERAADEIDRLRGLLREANDAFDECTGDYAKELVADEPWRKEARGA